jgi:DNA-binding NtrC family response regulator
VAYILVIDDEEILLYLISNTLRMEGHEVVSLTDPLAALELKTFVQRPFDLLLADIHTKQISGFELVKRLALNGITLPVLFMSGYPASTTAIASGLGHCSLLEKPFTAQQLRAAVKKALHGKSSITTGEA